MGTISLYAEAFLEASGLHYRWRVYENGEGAVCIEYQENDSVGSGWKATPFDGFPIDQANDLCRAIKLVCHFAKGTETECPECGGVGRYASTESDEHDCETCLGTGKCPV
jgi:hypothetical protein